MLFADLGGKKHSTVCYMVVVYKQKMKLKKGILIIVLIGIAYISVNFSLDKSELSGDFSSTEIRQIELGMTLEDVQKILGQPFQITSLAGLHDLSCERSKNRLIEDITPSLDIRQIVNEKFSESDFCCEGNKDDMAEKRVTLVYTKRIEFSKHYPMLWIHLDNNFKVKNVYAKQYDGYLGLDDPCIYSMNIDSEFENKELFEKNFK